MSRWRWSRFSYRKNWRTESDSFPQNELHLSRSATNMRIKHQREPIMWMSTILGRLWWNFSPSRSSCRLRSIQVNADVSPSRRAWKILTMDEKQWFRWRNHQCSRPVVSQPQTWYKDWTPSSTASTVWPPASTSHIKRHSKHNSVITGQRTHTHTQKMTFRKAGGQCWPLDLDPHFLTVQLEPVWKHTSRSSQRFSCCLLIPVTFDL